MWRIGQRVVCIHHYQDDGDINPSKGGVYTIREVELHEPTHIYGLLFEEITNHKRLFLNGWHEQNFSEIRFKPLDEKRIDIFRAMLKNKEKETVYE